MTTRVRINIPGSRPIPPLVMRKPVTGAAGGAADTKDEPAAEAPSASADTAAAPGTPGGRRAEEPLARPAQAPARPGGGGTNGGTGGGRKASDWFAPRRATPNGPPSPASASPAAPASGAPRPASGARGSAPVAPGPAAGRDPRADRPHPAEELRRPGGPGAGAAPADPAGPAAGRGPSLPPGFQQPGGAGASGAAYAGAPPVHGGVPRTGGGAPPPPPSREDARRPGPHGSAGPDDPAATGSFGPPPAGSYAGSGAGAPAGPHGPRDDARGPYGPAADHREGPGAAPGRGPGAGDPDDGPPDDGRYVSGDTLSGVPVVREDEDAARPAPAGKARRKGRSKVALLGALLVVAAVGTYGTGLLLDHSEVPRGTTVLGVAIGGTTEEAAVEKLDAAIGDRAQAPLTVSVEGKRTSLKPSVAGLGIDTKATVRNAAGRDYNPVSVVGSLFGAPREAQPALRTDREKLVASLRTVAGEAGAAKDGTIEFRAGEAVPVPGKVSKGLDVDRAVAAVSAAYRDRAATGEEAPVELPSSTQKPTIDQAEIDRAMKEFAQPAMSGLVTVQTDPAHTISFSPENSLPKFLKMKAVNGRLVDTYDLKQLQVLYGSTFDDVLIQRGNGQKTPVTPQDVAGALREALRGKTPEERVGVIETDPS